MMGLRLSCFLLALLPFTALAEHHSGKPPALYAAIKAFSDAYENNDVETYFGFYADDATIYFYGARQDVSSYHDQWIAMVQGGGGVEMDEASDLRIQVTPSEDVAVATYFVANRTRYADGTRSEVRAFETDVWQKIDGAWKIISLHFSEIQPEN